MAILDVAVVSAAVVLTWMIVRAYTRHHTSPETRRAGSASCADGTGGPYGGDAGWIFTGSDSGASDCGGGDAGGGCGDGGGGGGGGD